MSNNHIWKKLGNEIPYFSAITSDVSNNIDDFLNLGVQEINDWIEYLEKNNVKLNKENALDFGCGPGRLVCGLSDHFDKVIGFDISEGMIIEAKKNCHDLTNVDLILSENFDPNLFTSKFDLIYSNHVLQHMVRNDVIDTLHKFIDLLGNDGVLLIQIPNKRTNPTIKNFLADLLPINLKRFMYKMMTGIDYMNMSAISESEVCAVLDEKLKKVDVLIKEKDTNWSQAWYIYQK